MAQYTRDEINKIGGYYAFSKELLNGDTIFDFDVTKLSVHTRDIGLAGIEVYDILRDEYDIQIEFGDIGNLLAYISVGDRQLDLERLVAALAEIKRRYAKDKTGIFDHEYIKPQVATTPQKAFYAPKDKLCQLLKVQVILPVNSSCAIHPASRFLHLVNVLRKKFWTI